MVLIEKIVFIKIVFIIVSIIVLYLFIRFISSLIRPRRTHLSEETKSRADRAFNSLIIQFEHRYDRVPSRRELFRGAIEASHIIEKSRGWTGHCERQRIRKYLLEKNKVVKNFRMR
jgi:uncharacterized membrane protein